MSARCWCGRPVATDYADAVACAEHDDAPPRHRDGFPHPGLAVSIVLALVVFAIACGWLLNAFAKSYDVQPSPDGPVVVPAVTE